MQGRTLTRPLLLSALALAFAGTTMAQTTDTPRPAAAKQGTAKPSAAKPAQASKRLDFAPSQSLSETTTRSAERNHSQPARTSEKQGSGCASQGIDA